MWDQGDLVTLANLLKMFQIQPACWLIGSYEGIGAGWQGLSQIEFEQLVWNSGVSLTAGEMLEFAGGQQQTINANIAAIESGVVSPGSSRREIAEGRMATLQALDSTYWRIGLRDTDLDPT